MRQAILDVIRRATGTHQLRAAQDLLGARVEEGVAAHGALSASVADAVSAARYADFRLQPWWERSLWEPVVQLAIRDHVRPGCVAFDVGCNAGAFAVQMSRQAGPRGTILAFEASPRIVGRTQYNLVQSGCTNVTLYHRAIWSSSGERVSIASGSHLNDRVEVGGGGGMVPTLALDDLIEATGLSPSFVKMDIEGAEFEALRGCPRLIAEGRPVMALEQAPDDMRCHALLTAANYRAIDLGTYRPIVTGVDFSNATGVNNVLFVPEEMAAASPYCDPRQEPVAVLPASAFATDAAGSLHLAEPFALPAGRYLIRADFTADGRDNEVFAGVDVAGETVFRYHTFTAFMAECYRDWVVQLDRPGAIVPFLRFLKGEDASLDWRGVEIIRLSAFDDLAPPLVF